MTRPVLLLFPLLLTYAFGDIVDNEVDTCNLPASLKKEIASYQEAADRIMQEVLSGGLRGFVYDELATFVDLFGSRMAGTENLERSIDYMLKKLKGFDLGNVHGEEVSIPHWVRGEESATLLSPRMKNIPILGFGYSVGTPEDGITAEAIVMKSFSDLEEQSSQVKDKIVIFNEDYESYGKTVAYRDYAASRSAKYGAVATLVSSITPFSMNTLHTGMQDYADNVTKIPTAAITKEDAHLLQRLQDRGNKLKIKIKMGAQLLPNTKSRNVIAEIVGTDTKSVKNTVLSGHIDSWDVGQGAMDDGGGAFISWASLVLLKKLELKPKRTLRCILWTSEEMGLIGAQAYAKQHKNELDKFNLIMESDEGTFTPRGITFAGSDDAACIIEEIVKLLKPMNATTLERSDDVGSDIMVFKNSGVPLAGLLNENEKYFWFHHTEADTMDVLDSATLDKCTAVWATVAYVVSDLSVDLPRK